MAIRSFVQYYCQESYYFTARSLTKLSLVLVCIFSLQSQILFAQQPHGIAVVELFTSEGCSSCPAAENVVMDIAKENKKDVYILEFHVDYWDHLGWKDPFSSAAYSDRQKAYAQIMALQNIYTPQAIVNGNTELVGSDQNRLRKIIGDELAKNQPSNIAIQSQSPDHKSVNVSYRIYGKSNDILNIALVQMEASTDVKKGENKGRQLHHIQIVREFKSIGSPGETGMISLSLPPDTTPGNLRVLAYMQDKKNWNIKGAVQSDALH